MEATRPQSRSYQPMPLSASTDEEEEGLEELRQQIAKLATKETDLIAVLAQIDKTFQTRRAPFNEELGDVVKEKEILVANYEAKVAPPPYPPAPGPDWLHFVDSGWFNAICNVVVASNLICMALSSMTKNDHRVLSLLNQFFLIWYVFELYVKWKYHERDLFFGLISTVWWNWLDAGIVIGGIFDQWIMAFVSGILPFKVQALSNFLGFLRLFRLLRILKVLKTVLFLDMAWTEEAPFQLFMSGVIAVNSIVMALELDIEWHGWEWFEQAFLVVYTFELIVRLKALGCNFFCNDDLVWNNLDFTMVAGGIFSLWLMPAYSMLAPAKSGKNTSNALSSFTKILRIAKILRVLRLVRLLRMIKPLYRLLMGVIAALDAMKWVMVLTMLVLYAGAIVFTSLIGHGYIYASRDDVPAAAQEHFGSVMQSIFSLFKVMNGDISVVEPITSNTQGRLLFGAFMILSNWAVLAILTSVVSDHMITSSSKLEDEEKKQESEDYIKARTFRLKTFFSDIDDNKDGVIIKDEWYSMLEDEHKFDILNEVTGRNKTDLQELFFVLSEEHQRGSPTKGNYVQPYLVFEDFINHLDHDIEGVDRSQILHLRYWIERSTHRKLEDVERRLSAKFQELAKIIDKAAPDSYIRGGDNGTQRSDPFHFRGSFGEHHGHIGPGTGIDSTHAVDVSDPPASTCVVPVSASGSEGEQSSGMWSLRRKTAKPSSSQLLRR